MPAGIPRALPLVQLPSRSWTPGFEESSLVATQSGPQGGREYGAAGEGGPAAAPRLAWAHAAAKVPSLAGTAEEQPWQPAHEHPAVAAPQCREDGHKEHAAAKVPSLAGSAEKQPWQPAQEHSTIVTPRCHKDGHEDGGECHSWARIRTPSPEGWYVSHGYVPRDLPAARTSRCHALPPQEQQCHGPHSGAPTVLPTAAPRPLRRLLLSDVLQRERAEGGQALDGKAFRGQHRAGEWPGADGNAGASGQAPAADAKVHSIGSAGHPHSCALPCKYSRGGRVCKDGAACNRCHFCPWRREKRDRAAEGQAHAES
ncbi:unnamed protein product [Prorocentrum cordatum]|uniref:C3H1-type domain-containing protein n=1 Tax=Prorocentrum cordatum TaxID=2364126 RepID=A0ABN9V8Q5_9DINO|nr:unnamed protein product [Polarella glacialis]